ncbi:hypothetical protein [Rhodopseudomonas telluris]|uniref:Uncharacterized protein n=1 Tax=Rhodopseudomonas telluris TaxID=644215 RepID=A0ABV6EVW4_9BRAD
MPNNASSRAVRLHQVVLQTALGVLGVCSAIWAAEMLPWAVLVTPARDVAELIASNTPFKPAVLKEVDAELAAARPEMTWTNPVAARASAMITLRLAQDSQARDSSEQVEAAFTLAESGIRAALRLNPSDSSLWTSAYLVRTARAEFNPSDTRLLAQSYVTGPHEGWVSVTRNRLALAAYPILDRRTQDLAISEFSEMVGSGMIDDAAINLLGVGWDQRDGLLASLATVGLPPKEALARRLEDKGARISVPGVRLETRPWR